MPPLKHGGSETQVLLYPEEEGTLACRERFLVCTRSHLLGGVHERRTTLTTETPPEEGRTRPWTFCELSVCVQKGTRTRREGGRKWFTPPQL